MLEYLQRYNQLPQALRDSLATPATLAAIRNLESKYKVNLALVVMKAAIGEFTPASLNDGLVEDCRLSTDMAQQLASDLRQSVFFLLPDFKSAPQPTLTARPTTPTPAPTMPTNQSTANLSVDSRVDDLIKKAKIDLASQALIIRLKQIMRTYLLGVRDRLAAKDALMKPVELGGLAFSADLTDSLLKLADGKNPTTPPVTRPSLPTSLEAKPSDNYDLLSSLKASGKSATPADPLAKQSRLSSGAQVLPAKSLPANLPWHDDNQSDQVSAPQPAKPKPTVRPSASPVKASPIIKLTTEPSVAPSKPANVQPAAQVTGSVSAAPSTAPSPLIKASAAQPNLPPSSSTTPTKPVSAPVSATVTAAAKPKSKEAPVTVIQPQITGSQPVEPQYSKTESGAVKMDDIQFTPKVFTPIDELRYMTLKNFRNLSANPVEATTLIKKKLDSLAKDDFSWKLEGISAWKQSPVNKMYVDIYHRALSQGKQIPQIIADSLASDPQAMSAPEFEAIFSFNQEVSLLK